MNRKTVRPNLEIADQPTSEEILGLKAEGFTAVVNLRRPGEPDQPMDPAAEAEVARQAGLDYLSVPVGGEPLGAPQISSVCDLIDRHPDGKVLIHCKQGGRAAGLALLHLARVEGWPAGEVVERGRALGLELPPPVRALIEHALGR
ncbi:beta-lactamase hydrolase domain-containing protein [Tautonia plasticadhaerens]|uniref:Beta-lactamase hydrolase-like protein n=1 Tax=Tautonia plasticadhaerens TaxID=2527974 RepID=A0A518GY78_9BACT|nr:sulfur transferase domain-containing protein [Tautonia plasticadhaerens]QDV33523.1 Beta-lactamase hydrolase-like protein [Tautonia plasticadhaerens]